ncbi:MAG: oligosaccharide flippase family protein [Paludibacter sp.]|nr:oligosaccharide flippase family protein [Paludibacter sp.]
MSELKRFFNKFLHIFSNSEHKRIAINILYLTILNGIYFISPLILIPYLIKTIGSEMYGIYIFSWTFIYYFIFIVNYGFDYSSTREISIHKYDIDKVSEIFSVTFYSRLFLLLVSIVLLFLCVFFIDKLNENAKLILLGIGVIVGQSIFPTWLFQGMEEMKFITIVNSIIRILPIVLVFIFVKSTKDVDLIILFQSIGFVIGGIFSHFFAIKHFNLKLLKPQIHVIKNYLISSFGLFFSTIGISLYRETNTVMLGFLTNNFELVGFYALADKFIRIMQLIANSFSQAIFPFFGHSLIDNRKEAIIKFKKISIYYAIFLMCCSIGLYISIPWLLNLYLGKSYPEIILDVRIMTPVILVGGLNYYFGVVGLLNFNHKNAFTTFVLIAGAFNLIFCYILGIRYLDIGAAISLTMAELVLLGLILFYLNKKENIFKSF